MGDMNTRGVEIKSHFWNLIHHTISHPLMVFTMILPWKLTNLIIRFHYWSGIKAHGQLGC